MGKGIGYGKVILFCEHFVVYQVPSIVSAIEKATAATVEPLKGLGWILDDSRPETPGYKAEKLAQQRDSIERVLKAAGVDLQKNPIKIALGGNLVASSGIGASAASCVAIARAISDQFNLSLPDSRINEIAYEGERAYHGTPSGVDNTAATYGGLLWFVRGKPIERISIKRPVEIVMANTGIVANTEKAVAGVRERKQKNPEKYNKIFKEAEELVYMARKALSDYKLRTVGELMNKNHQQLQAIEVSNKELDSLVELAYENGAFGAKMTGGGLGGNIVALTPGRGLQDQVARAIKEEGFEVLMTRIG